MPGVDQYLRLRRQSGFDPRLNYTQVHQSAATFTGKVFEMKGTVEGFIRREQSVSFLFNTDDKSGIMLTAPTADTDLVTSGNHQVLRVLVRVSEGNSGNVVPLETIAVAYDAEVLAKERTAAAKESPRSSTAPAPVTRYGTSEQSSRGYVARPMSGAVSGLSALAQRVLSPEAAIPLVYR